MTTTAKYGLTHFEAGTQGEATVNDWINRLTTLVGANVISASTTATPGSPTDGDFYLVPLTGLTGQWSTDSAGGKYALYYNGWIYIDTQVGDRISVRDGTAAGLTFIYNSTTANGNNWIGEERMCKNTPVTLLEHTLMNAPHDLVITEIRHGISGTSSPSADWTFRHDSDRTATGTEVNTGGDTTTSTTTVETDTTLDAPNVDAGDWIWVEITAVSGTITEHFVQFSYRWRLDIS